MNSITFRSAQQVAKYMALLILVLLMVDLSVGLPSSSNLMNNRLFAHVIRTRSLAKKYCGPHIVNILSLLCDGNYFSPSKRNHLNVDNNVLSSSWDDLKPKGDSNTISEDDGSDNYFLEPKKAFNMFKREASGAGGFTRNRRGIVDECCRKACTIKTLYSYCE